MLACPFFSHTQETTGHQRYLICPYVTTPTHRHFPRGATPLATIPPAPPRPAPPEGKSAEWLRGYNDGWEYGIQGRSKQPF